MSSGVQRVKKKMGILFLYPIKVFDFKAATQTSGIFKLEKFQM